METRYDSLIQELASKYFPEVDWHLIKSQVAQESSFNPDAKSPCGALGLLQLMPSTAAQIFSFTPEDLLDPEKNLSAGIQYLRMQYRAFPEIPERDEKFKFALASYNAGRGYINKALELAYAAEVGVAMPKGHKGAKPGAWQTWAYAKDMLKRPSCAVSGKTPDWKQAIDYVERIWARYQSGPREQAIRTGRF